VIAIPPLTKIGTSEITGSATGTFKGHAYTLTFTI
jgi:hypothetical protein